MDCTFCKIINGNLPSMKVYEDEYTLVFMDIAKDVDGHMVAIPKKHILLFIHGGPGQSESAIAYMVEEYVERNYNIVYYDQRGAGKTYLKNKKIKPNTEALKQDLLEIVCYLKKLYKKEKIGIIGHSWGSVLGSMFALEHPEHTLCYISCGQVINIMENERIGFSKLKEEIEKSGSKKDQKKLLKIGEYPTSNFDMHFVQKMGKVRDLQGKYKLASSIDRNMTKIYLKSPIIGIKDVLPFMVGSFVNLQVMKELMNFDLREKGINYEVPVFYVMGENDQQTPIVLGKKYFYILNAPMKELFEIKNAGHMTMLDNVEDYRKAICGIVNKMS